MVKAAVSFFDRLMQDYTPDPFLLVILLTVSLFGLGLVVTPSSPMQLITYWGDGFWGLIQFTLQMVMVLVGGYIIAVAPPIKKGLTRIAQSVSTSGQAVVVVTLIALVGSYLNWGLGLVIGGIVCREIAKILPGVNYRLLVASSYSGFIVWHGGLSASIPLVIATEGHFTQHLTGVIPISQTLFAPLNITAIIGMFLILPVANWALGKIHPDNRPVDIQEDSDQSDSSLLPENMVPAEKLENSMIVSLLVASMGFLYIIAQIYEGKFSLGLNDVNFVLLMLAIFCHGTPRSLLNALTDGAKRVGPILIQFPFYAGIMGMMASSSLAQWLSDIFVASCTAENFPLLTFYSAGFLNMFIPSGGGQWAVQGPIILEAARQIGADISKVALAVAWGDAWTNLLQPFWALPLLAIAGLKIRDIMGYCVSLLFITGVFLTAIFLVF
ncbi:MAG: short-chain fatty acid transporter [Alphaproteobacteria bacterium]